MSRRAARSSALSGLISSTKGSGAIFSPANAISNVEDDDDHVAPDAAGNLARIPRLEADRTILGHRKCVYDAWNRLVKVRTDASTPADVAVMTYDGLGRRIKKSLAKGHQHRGLELHVPFLL